MSITSLGDMNQETYDFYVQPLMDCVAGLEEEKKKLMRMCALLVEAAGGEVTVSHRQLLLEDDGLTIFREDRLDGEGIRYIAKRKEPVRD